MATVSRPPVPPPAELTLQSAPLLDDQPSTTDLLNFEQFAAAFERIIVNPQTKTPFIIGIFGRWGTGKTTLMRMLERRLEPMGATTVWFNAWLYNQEEHIWASFLQSLTDRLADRLRPWDKWRFAVGVYRRGLAWTRLLYEVPRLVVRMLLVGVPVVLGAFLATRAPTELWQRILESAGAAGSAAVAVWALLRPGVAAMRKEGKPDFSLYRSMDFERHVAFLDHFREQFARIVASLPRVNRRVVV